MELEAWNFRLTFSNVPGTSSTCWAVRAPDIRRGYRPVATDILFMLSVLHATHSPVAFVFKGPNSPLRSAVQVQKVKAADANMPKMPESLQIAYL